jgi:8-oxo-dGTP pyrophosphatase MutT (NUDIX family)
MKDAKLEANPWTTLSSEHLYSNPWLKVRHDKVLRPDGSPGTYTVVEACKVATGIVALTGDGRIHLVGQYRYPTKQYSWEIVEGGAEPDEAPLEAAKRELQEEVGLEAAHWEQLGKEVHLSNCISDERAVFFIARELREVGATPDVTEVLQPCCVPLSQAFAMLDSGQITDAMSIIALSRLRLRLKEEGGLIHE